MILAEDIVAEVGGALEQVEQELRRVLSEGAPDARAISLHLAESGGKRVRPLMTLLAGRVFTEELSPVIPVATAAEMIHMATLVHDDVIDGATMRRGRATVNARWGNLVSVLTGDMLLAKSLVWLVERGGPEIVKIMADMIYQMCEGEIAQNLTLYDLNQTEEDYFNRIEKKTALFFAACCQSGALVAGATPEQAEALARFGRHLGMAFQIIDDVLDVTGEPSVIGKPVGHDLASGVLTLPLLFCLRQRDIGERLRPLLREVPFTPEQVNDVLALLRENGAVDYAHQVAAEFARRAEDELAALPKGRGRELLEAVVAYSLERRS